MNGTHDLGSPSVLADEILANADLKPTVRPTECSTSTRAAHVVSAQSVVLRAACGD
ncbi:hypothetical protein [Aquihabitans sp. McL0605]|uniref:hypothetical protein n=1 Tax=Aquihabitans sp. McL0605 TaxID=3415671 RepID=UPI003CEAAB51